MLLALLLLACDSETPATPDDSVAQETGDSVDPNAPTWHQDVAPIFSRSCDGCHAPGGIGSPTWTEPEDVAFLAPLIERAVGGRTMPPWYAEGECNSYKGDFSLSEAEIDTILAWAAADAPLGDPAEPAELPPAFEAPALERVDITLPQPEPYFPTEAPDEYRCFVTDWPAEQDTWITGYEVEPENQQLVHHVIAFLIAPGDVETYKELDAEAEGLGYPCFGAPGPDILSLINAKWLGAWAPGSGATTLPEGKGLRVPAGSAVVHQVHYFTAGAPGQSDQSSLRFQVETESQQWADVQPWTDVNWVVGFGMEIPANSEDVTHTFEYEVTERDGDFKMYGAALHLHKLGKSARLSVLHPDGSEDCVLQHEVYDFDWQRSYVLEEPVQLNTGDTVRLSCTWDNPTDEDVAWGDGTGDEMCLGITMLAD
ncbi:MAG: monooxygenase [Alphaproteobacteria bacterium]|nr:monooxygenase [Alphaproteobacteria bacterium]